MTLSNSYNYTVQGMPGLAESSMMKWESMRSPVPMVGSVIVYMFVIFFAVPRFMKNRKAYSLKSFIHCYNIFQVIANFWFSYNMVMHGGSWSVFWRYCDTIDSNCGRNAEKQLEFVWGAMWLRVVDFIETVVFLLRKKDRQVSVLHVYHHITTPLFFWALIKYLFHGFVLFMAMINSAMHTIMYLYYLLSSYGPNMQQRLNVLKKWITTLQMIQILIIMLGCIQGFISNCDDRSRYFSMIVSCNGMLNFALFSKFYINSYIRVKKE